MSNNQHKVLPVAARTKLFHNALGCLPNRQRTNQSHATVPENAAATGQIEKSIAKPGARRATFAAGLTGYPVSMAIQTTHTVSAHREKNTTENQSTKAATDRFRVGSANAATSDSEGNASKNTLSDVSLAVPVIRTIAVSHSGPRKCGMVK
jgi:hypothetical protein